MISIHTTGKHDTYIQSPLMPMKLHAPTLPDTVLQRSKLAKTHKQLSQLVIITAPDGFGKTTLMAQWAAADEQPCAWLSLDSRDNTLYSFWQQLVAAIDLAAPGFAAQCQPALGLISQFGDLAAVRMVRHALIACSAGCTIFLDDFDRITHPAIVQSLHCFLQELPDSYRMVVSCAIASDMWSTACREMQPTYIQVTDLQLDASEIELYSQKYHVNSQTRHSLLSLAEASQGCILYIKLAYIKASYLKKSLGQLETPVFQSTQDLMDAFLAQLSADQRSFLLATCVADEINLPLLSAVIERSVSECTIMVDQLRQLGLVLCLPQSMQLQQAWLDGHELLVDEVATSLDVGISQSMRPVYCVEQAIRQLAEKHLNQLEPTLKKRMSRNAACFCEKNEQLEQAFYYYLDGFSTNEALRVFKQLRQQRITVDWGSLFAKCRQVPMQDLILEPDLCFSYILHQAHTETRCDHQSSMQLLEQAETCFHSLSQEKRDVLDARFWGSFYFARGIVQASSTSQNVQQAVHELERSAKYLPDGTSIFWAMNHASIRTSLIRSATALPRAHQLSQSMVRPFLKQMIALLLPVGFAGKSCIMLGEYYYVWNALLEAESFAQRAISMANPAHPVAIEVLLPAWLLQARIKVADGKVPEARQLLKQARLACTANHMQAADLYLEGELVKLGLMSGDLSAADSWLKRVQIHESDEPSLARLYEFKLLVRILLHKSRIEKAWDLSCKLVKLAIDSDRLLEAIELYILQALIMQAGHEDHRAMQVLKHALFLSETEGFVRPYTDEGRPMANLLSKMVGQWPALRGQGAPKLGYVRSILATLGQEQGRRTGQPYQQHSRQLEGEKAESTAAQAVADGGTPALLTKQERAIFQLLARQYTNQEIADQLHVSYGTVRTHLNHIYGKLRAVDRMDALRKGRALGL